MHSVAVIVGSIRKGSNNAKLARALGKLAEGKLTFRFIRIDDLPLFNQDDASEPHPPRSCASKARWRPATRCFS